MDEPRAYFTNLRPGGWPAMTARAVCIVVVWLAVVVPPVVALDWYAGWCARVPSAPDILVRDEAVVGPASSATWILGSEGARLGGSALEVRPWVSRDDLPPLLIAAFVAAEDETFFSHAGVEPRGLARAAWTNLRRSQIAQGGSTITQQLAKMYVGRERSYERKLREAILARRIERRFSKLEILEAYLNRIYLGAGAHGVAAAAERYFAKRLDALELHEVALLAGLTSAPSRLDPLRNPAGALGRRTYVLRRMAELGVIDEAERAAADAQPLGLSPTAFGDGVGAPYVAGAARRELGRLSVAWPAEGRQRVIETTASLALQQQAEVEVARGAERLARNRRDPVRLARLAPSEWGAFLQDATARYEASGLEVAQQYTGLVVEVAEAPARLRVALSESVVAEVSGEGLAWAVEPGGDAGANPKKKKRKSPKAATTRPLHGRVAVGDVVQVRLTRAPAEGVAAAELLPVAEIQGALVSLELDSGAVRALAGGTGFEVSQFNRATRGCRQPGSVFKPILYALALARGLTVASLVHDFPVRFEDAQGRLVWEPRNADRDFKGTLTLAAALASSRNLPTVKLAQRLGLHSLAETARALGIRTSTLRATPSLALGASCVTPLEMTSVYGAFARRGLRLEPYLVRSAYTAEGRLVLDRGHVSEPAGPLDARLHRAARWYREPAQRVLSAEVAYLTVYLLRQVVEAGTASVARALGAPAAGKTGTTNRYDVWFVGFSEDVLTGVWLGDDLNRRDLGEGESGGTSALPVWLGYMRQAVVGRSQADPLDGPPAGVTFHRIDPETGKLAHPKGPGRWMPFAGASAPLEVAPGPTEREASSADLLDRGW